MKLPKFTDGISSTEQKPAAWNGPGETPHKYSPDYMAMGDCRICGHTRKAHPHPPSMSVAQAALEAYGREKVREGMRRAADIAAVKPSRGGRPLSGPHHAGIRRGRNEAARLILAEMEKLK